jgi:hypothetical protein
MGTQAKLKRSRHELRRAEKAAMAELHDANSARPEIRAAFAAIDADEGLQRLLVADRGEQKTRLAAAGWRLCQPAPDGLGLWDHRRARLRLIHSLFRETDGLVWGHISLSSPDGDLPGWYPLRNANWLVYPGRTGIVVVAPESRHVNISECTHVWTCLEGSPLPDFGRYGVI